MEIVPGSGYGVVVLLNSGSGLMLDQTRIFYGVRDIVEGTNLTPPGPAGAKFNATTLDRVLGLLTVAVLLLGASGVLRARRWGRRRRQQSWIFAAARTCRTWPSWPRSRRTHSSRSGSSAAATSPGRLLDCAA
jgi:hypothetical protein